MSYSVNTSYSSAVSSASKVRDASTDAKINSAFKKLEAKEFEIDERAEFEKNVKGASEKTKKGSTYGSILGGLGAAALGLAAAPAALVVGATTLVGGMASGREEKKYLQDSRFYKMDANLAEKGIRNQLIADTVMSGILAGTGAKGAEEATAVTDGTTKLATTDVVNKRATKKAMQEVGGEATDIVQSKTKEFIGNVGESISDTYEGAVATTKEMFQKPLQGSERINMLDLKKQYQTAGGAETFGSFGDYIAKEVEGFATAGQIRRNNLKLFGRGFINPSDDGLMGAVSKYSSMYSFLNKNNKGK